MGRDDEITAEPSPQQPERKTEVEPLGPDPESNDSGR